MMSEWIVAMPVDGGGNSTARSPGVSIERQHAMIQRGTR